MSWRSGSKLFVEIWPSIQSNIPDRELRIDFTSELLSIFVKQDMDPFDVEDIHSDVRAAMRLSGIEISEPERYKDDEPTPEGSTTKRKWWKPW
ncbi:hypothetical protein [Pseudoduganella sp. OTU4001]|uniref:hypothetical protein n=1 Tax=Pseudoduganella sp. OTU4001 TaxID=3043854 RepID=UPI00313C5066